MGSQRAIPGIAPSGSHAGRTRQATGAAAERVVERMHDACATTGLCTPLLRLDAGVRIGPGGRAVVRTSAAVDYAATLTGGRSLVLEVKSLDEPRWRLRNLSPEQRQALEWCWASGGLALVMIVASEVEVYAVPWGDLRTQYAAGVVSLGREDMGLWRVPVGGLYLRRWV